VPAYRLALVHIAAFTLAVGLSACASPSASGSTADGGKAVTKTEPAKPASDGPLTPELRAKVCAAEHVDETSQIFLARNKAGVAERIVLTPSRTIADMGNLVFDMNGELLGHDTGSEFPWDDEARRNEERARVAKLMGGAMVASNATPRSCVE
jgi:hypothetical protein